MEESASQTLKETGNKETNNNSMSKKDFRFAYLIVMCAGETCIHPKSDEFVWALGVRKHTYHRLELVALMMCKSLNGMTPEYCVQTTKHHID